MRVASFTHQMLLNIDNILDTVQQLEMSENKIQAHGTN